MREQLNFEGKRCCTEKAGGGVVADTTISGGGVPATHRKWSRLATLATLLTLGLLRKKTGPARGEATPKRGGERMSTLVSRPETNNQRGQTGGHPKMRSWGY